MKSKDYLQWLAKETLSTWWHDSADPVELEESLSNSAVGVTTNPVLISNSIYSNPNFWKPVFSDIPKDIKGPQKVEEIMKRVIQKLSPKLMPFYNETMGKEGYICAQVNPLKPGNAEEMFDMAKRFFTWAPNIAVKLPVTSAGLDALEECIAIGMTITATVSFTVPQVLAVAKRYEKGVQRAKKAGITPGQCFAVIMVGRIDDYLRDVALDQRAKVKETDITQAGLAITKRAYSIFKENNYKARLLPAGMRGAYHISELANGEMVFSVHPKIQVLTDSIEKPWENRIDVPVEKDVIERLNTIHEFVRAYEPDVMKPEEFITYGIVQKTLSQFCVEGWNLIEKYNL